MQNYINKPIRRTSPYNVFVRDATKITLPTMSFLVREEVLLKKTMSLSQSMKLSANISDGIILSSSASNALVDIPTFGQIIYDGVTISDTVSIIRQHWLSGIVPGLLCYVWNPWDISPSGHRHLVDSQGFLHDASSDNIIDFGRTDVPPVTSDSRAITFRVAPQSGVFSVTNLRLWQSQTGAYTPSDTTINFEAIRGSGWDQFYDNSSASILPTTLPASQNVFREDGGAYIDSGNMDGSFPAEDANTSQFCYLSVNLSSVWPVQTYDSSTTLAAIKCSYDYMIGGYYPNTSGVT